MIRDLNKLALVLAVAVMGMTACGGRQEKSRPFGDPLKDTPAQTLYQGGLAFAAAQDHVRAEQYFVAAIAKGYPEKKVMPALVRTCVEGSRLRAALSHGVPYLARNPDDWRLRFVVATIHLSLGEHSTARAELERVSSSNPQFADAQFVLGEMAESGLDLARAKLHFARYLALAPDGSHANEAREGMARQPPRTIQRENKQVAKRRRGKRGRS